MAEVTTKAAEPFADVKELAHQNAANDEAHRFVSQEPKAAEEHEISKTEQPTEE